MSNFKILASDGNARVGELVTGHGVVQTPVFMPVGTQASVKALSPDDLKIVGAQIILGNTYHLYLRPGSKLVREMGGLHKFMNWDGPILTDSGGFQAFSLGAAIAHGVGKTGGRVKGQGESKKQKILHPLPLTLDPYEEERGDNGNQKREEGAKKTIRQSDTVSNSAVKSVFTKIVEDGVEFKSHLDGSKHLLTPEKSIEVQLDLGSDIVLVLDELVSPLHPLPYILNSLERTHRWEMRSQEYFQKHLKTGINSKAQLFGILQGIDDFDIRTREAKWIAKQDFAGISIGGSFGVSSVSDEHVSHAIDKTMDWVTPLLPASLPLHALGIGEVVDFFECIKRGVDMFDCVAPTRRARNGSLYISPKNSGNPFNKFTFYIHNAEFTNDKNPINPGCECYTCQNFTRAYLRHLLVSRELLYHRLATIHNVHFMINLVGQIRQAILDGQFIKLKSRWLD